MFMLMWRFVFLAFLPGLAFAESVEDEAQGCMFSSDPADLRNCLSDVFYRRGFELDDRIAAVTSSLPGATGLRAEVLASQYDSDQTAWRYETDEKCDGSDQIVRELCRLAALKSREVELRLELQETLREYGG